MKRITFLRWMHSLWLTPFRFKINSDRFSMQPGGYIVYARNLEEALAHAADVV